MAWSKFDPHAPPVDPLVAANPQAQRRAALLRWGVWISQGMVVLGFGLMAYWLFV